MGKKYKYRVLIYGAGGRQVLPMAKGFRELGCYVVGYCASRLDTGFLSRYINKRVLFDSNNQKEEGFYEYGMKFIKSGDFDLVVPLGDEGAEFLSQRKEELSKYAKIAVNDWDVFSKVIDKSKTMEICKAYSIPAPRTIFSDNPIDEIRKGLINYPVVVKPKTGVGSIGFNIVRTENDLVTLLSKYDNKNGPLFVQEYIKPSEMPQYGAEMFRDKNGNIRASLVLKKPRWFPIDGGSTVLGISVFDAEIVESCTKLLNALNWNGYANFDLVWDAKDKCAKILEINGRISAVVKLSFLAGVNISQLILENEFGNQVSDMRKYRENVQISCFLADCLWFLKAKNRLTCTPSWFSRWNIKDTIFSWKDPLPSIGFLITSILSFRKSMRARRRS